MRFRVPRDHLLNTRTNQIYAKISYPPCSLGNNSSDFIVGGSQNIFQDLFLREKFLPRWCVTATIMPLNCQFSTMFAMMPCVTRWAVPCVTHFLSTLPPKNYDSKSHMWHSNSATSCWQHNTSVSPRHLCKPMKLCHVSCLNRSMLWSHHTMARRSKALVFQWFIYKLKIWKIGQGSKNLVNINFCVPLLLQISNSLRSLDGSHKVGGQGLKWFLSF